MTYAKISVANGVIVKVTIGMHNNIGIRVSKRVKRRVWDRTIGIVIYRNITLVSKNITRVLDYEYAPQT